MGRRMTAIEAPEWHTATMKSPIQANSGTTTAKPAPISATC
jgi:hypothetical protein